MTKDEEITDDETMKARGEFLRHSDFVINSSFVIRHSSLF
jgi:hypothetical protein